MAKFNQIQKERRANIQNRKRAVHGDPNTRKLKQKAEPIPISGKRKRKLFKKWRRVLSHSFFGPRILVVSEKLKTNHLYDQEKRAAIETGLVTMEDIEMEVADGTSGAAKEKSLMKFHLKKASRFRIKRLKAKGTGKKKSSSQSDIAPNDAMVE